MKLNGGCATNTGNTRPVNQDAISFRSFQQKGQYFAMGIVCDGVGGLVKSEIASETVIRSAVQWFNRVVSWIDIRIIDPEILFSHLKDAVEEWNRDLREIRASRRLATGTTLSILILVRDRYYTVQVGDSRIYLYQNGLQQLTVDATVSRLKNGQVKAYLTNYMGKEEDIWFTSSAGVVKKGDIFLYGSDGFWHLFTEKDVDLLRASGLMKENLNSICETVIHTLMARGERDNISVGIIAIES